MNKHLLNKDLRDDIRSTVLCAMEYWPNSHLGSYTRQEDMRAAFKMLRRWAQHYHSMHAAVGALERNVSSYVDM